MSADQQQAAWIMGERAALYGVTLAVVVCLVIAVVDRWVNR